MYQSTGISLYDMGMVYKEMISESAVPGKPAERLKTDSNMFTIPDADREAAKKRTLEKAAALRKKREMGEANDGNLANNYPPYDQVTRGDVIAGATGNDEMGGKKKKKKNDKKLKEGLSNWRNDLREVINGNSKESNIEIVTGLPPGKKNKIIPNPPFGNSMKEAVEGIGGELMEMIEIDDENLYLNESIDIASEYFYEQGLNEHGLDILIEDMGLENFVDFVFEISEDYNLFEARTLIGKKKNPQKLPKGTQPTTATKRQVATQGTTRKLSSFNPSSSVKKKTSAIKTAVEKQPEANTQRKSSPIKDAIARGIFGAVNAYRAGMERHKTAMGLAKETGKTIGKAAKVAGEAGRRSSSHLKTYGLKIAKEEINYSKSEIQNTFKSLKKYREYFRETATTTQTPPIDPKQTSSIDPKQVQQLATLKRIQDQKLALQRQGKLPMNASYQPEGELVDEAKADDDLSPEEKAKAREERSGGQSDFTRQNLTRARRGKSPKGMKPSEPTQASMSMAKYTMALNQPGTRMGRSVQGNIAMDKAERGPSGRRGS